MTKIPKTNFVFVKEKVKKLSFAQQQQKRGRKKKGGERYERKKKGDREIWGFSFYLEQKIGSRMVLLLNIHQYMQEWQLQASPDMLDALPTGSCQQVQLPLAFASLL
jgi:hypothetical protein